MPSEAQLSDLAAISLDASPSLNKWKVRNKYKEHWSPTSMALLDQVLAMVQIQRHLGALPLPAGSSLVHPLSQEVQQGMADPTRGGKEWSTPSRFQTGHPRMSGE